MNRVPDRLQISQQSTKAWMQTMIDEGLFYHPDDDPSDIFRMATKQRTFNPNEADKLRDIYSSMFNVLGDEVYEIGCEEMGIGQSDID